MCQRQCNPNPQPDRLQHSKDKVERLPYFIRGNDNHTVGVIIDINDVPGFHDQNNEDTVTASRWEKQRYDGLIYTPADTCGGY